MAKVRYRIHDAEGVVYATVEIPLCPRLGEVVTIADEGRSETLGPFEVLNIWHDLRRGLDGEWVQTVDILVQEPSGLPDGFMRPQ